ncbi:glycoside hydrolase [Lichtheimia hyalospora FSU 10163]|nr:glycoside hydrolase [Lichtheimia hyalospora FSU 10163]
MHVHGQWFIEPKTNRTVLFRGVNVGGGTKVPPTIPSHEPSGYWQDYDRNVTFVGRPFPLEEADLHLQRLVDHGFNLLRFMVTWEAIEHQGPGIYDEEYIDYVIALLHKCQEYNLKVFMNPHQDTWSRHCGGSGHPGWTHLLAGLNPDEFAATGAALVHNVYPDPENFPKMIWHTNYQKLASATMFTLFFAGKTFAPKCIVNDIHIQDYLQSHYINAFKQVTQRIHAEKLQGNVVIGYDTMNEPGTGYIGKDNITKLSDDDVDFKKGDMPTAFQGMKLGSGIPTKVERWVFSWHGPKKDGHVLIDPGHARAWLSPSDRTAVDTCFSWKRADDWHSGCIWALHGVWDPSTESVMRPDYFSSHPITHEPISYQHFWLDFVKTYADMILHFHKDAILFIQPPIMEVPPSLPSKYKNLAFAPHWYDGLTLVKKQWCNYNVDYINLKRGKYGHGPLRFIRALRIGEKAIRQCFVDQIKTLKEEGCDTLGEYPFVLGETGIPYDMQPVKASALSRAMSYVMVHLLGLARMLVGKFYPINGPVSPQNKAMDATINAAERNLVSYTLWTYVPDNHTIWGDLWNGEDLSIWQESAIPRSSLQDGDNGSVTDTSSDTLLPDQPDSLSNKKTNVIGTGINARNIISLHRPHPHKVAGTPLSIQFTSPTEKTRANYTFTFQPNKDTQGPTEIYVPLVHFPTLDEQLDIVVSSGKYEMTVHNDKYWMLAWWCDNNADKQTLHLTGITQTLI